ncbi:hypothetical protein FB451DRAFT_1448546 [Mycena latifolia]|nr:hypothetical protein FB451DRAFT_1448546 [Mycena latifolia]
MLLITRYDRPLDPENEVPTLDQDEDASNDVQLSRGRPACRMVVHDSDSDSYNPDAGSDHSEIEKAPAQGSAQGNEYGDGDELEYFDEPEPHLLHAPVEDDDVDRAIEYFEAPGIDYSGPADVADTGLTATSDAERSVDGGDGTPPQVPVAAGLPASSSAQLPATTSAQTSAPTALGHIHQTANNNVLPPRRAANKRKVVELDSSTCVCGEAVTESERNDGSSAIKCSSKAGCEAVWYHSDCVDIEAGRKGWVCGNASRAAARSVDVKRGIV